MKLHVETADILGALKQMRAIMYLDVPKQHDDKSLQALLLHVHRVIVICDDVCFGLFKFFHQPVIHVF